MKTKANSNDYETLMKTHCFSVPLRIKVIYLDISITHLRLGHRKRKKLK